MHAISGDAKKVQKTAPSTQELDRSVGAQLKKESSVRSLRDDERETPIDTRSTQTAVEPAVAAG